MNEELADIQPGINRSATPQFFYKMLAISLAFHVICALLFAGGQTGSIGSPTINYLDLTMSEPAATVSRQSAAAVEPAPTPPPLPPLTQEAELPAPEPAPLPTEAEQLRQSVKNAVDSAAAQPEAMQKVSFGLGLLNGHFGTIADGKSLRDDMREYHLSLLRAVNEKWWQNETRPKGVSNAMVMITVARNGDIIDARIIQSSGSPSYDRSMLDSLKAASPVPPLPAYFEQAVYSAPIRFNVPLTMFGSPTG